MEPQPSETREIGGDEFKAIFQPIMRSIFAVTDYAELWCPEKQHFVHPDWISVLLPLDIVTADPRPDYAETDEIDPQTGKPPLVRNAWAESIWDPFMAMISARGSGDIAIVRARFRYEEPTWLARAVERFDQWVSRLLYGPDDPSKGIIVPGAFVGPPAWDTFVDARARWVFDPATYQVFPVNARWGAYCCEDRFTLLGGEPDWMTEFASRSGGLDVMRARFIGPDGPQWSFISKERLALERESLPRVANWGRFSR